MPKYFFHLAFEDRVILDSEGWELPDLSAARTRALEVARRMRAGSVVKAQANAAFYVVGTVSSLPLVVPFSEADGAGVESQRRANAMSCGGDLRRLESARAARTVQSSGAEFPPEHATARGCAAEHAAFLPEAA